MTTAITMVPHTSADMSLILAVPIIHNIHTTGDRWTMRGVPGSLVKDMVALSSAMSTAADVTKTITPPTPDMGVRSDISSIPATEDLAGLDDKKNQTMALEDMVKEEVNKKPTGMVAGAGQDTVLENLAADERASMAWALAGEASNALATTTDDHKASTRQDLEHMARKTRTKAMIVVGMVTSWKGVVDMDMVVVAVVAAVLDHGTSPR
jgi:hypothetical protein